MIYIGKCEYCGAENVPTISTPERDTQCQECHELTINNCKEAIKDLKKFRKDHGNKKVANTAYEKAEREAEEGLENLMREDYTR